MDDHSEGIQSEKPIPPWEQPGLDCEPHRGEQPDFFRRDCEPHRGELLRLLGIASLIVGCMTFPCASVPALVGIPLGLTTWFLARRDLAKMHQGRMDHAGERLTYEARSNALIGVALSVLGIAIMAALVLVSV
jgi:hypothetical protein